LSIKSRRFLSVVSQLFPIPLKRTHLEGKKSLKLLLHNKQYKLSYGRVLYSDGVSYFPFKLGFSIVGHRLQLCDSVLVLGAGIGSVGMMLSELVSDKRLEIDLVDINQKILVYCSFVMRQYRNLNTHMICQDAFLFVQNASRKYDLICIDLFEEDRVPQQFFSDTFIDNIRLLMHEQTIVVINMMFSSQLQQQIYEAHLQERFPSLQVIKSAPNFIYVIS
jgi:spermidine synthase